jgi:hypothetical protein
MLNRRLIRVFALTFIGVMAVGFLALRLTAVGGVDRCGNELFPDFAQIYVAGRQVVDHQGGSLYDKNRVYTEINRVLNATGVGGFYPMYPPITAVFGTVWSWMPYSTAAWLHAVLSVLVAVWLARDMARYFFGDSDGGFDGGSNDATLAMLLFLAFLPLWRVWMFGQCSVWALAALWLAWRLWTADASFAAGLMLSLGWCKPQLFIGAWLWAILWGNRSLRIALAAGSFGCIAVGMIFGGPTIWWQWLSAVVFSTTLSEHIQWVTSLPFAWKLVGGESLCSAAWITAATAGLGVVWLATLWQVKRRCPTNPPGIALALALFGGWFLMPRLYVYDWIIGWPLLLAAWKYGTARERTLLGFAASLFWVHDLFGVAHIPVLALAGLAVLLGLIGCTRWQEGEGCQEFPNMVNFEY